MCFYAIDFLKSAYLGLLYLNGMKTLWYRLKHYIFQSDAFSAIDFLIPQSTVPICPVYESKHSIKAHPFNLNKNEFKKKNVTRRKDTNQLWFFQFSFRHFGGTALSTKLGGSGGSFPSDPPQSTAGGTRSANDVRPPCHHYCLYFVLDTPTSNETKHANLVYHEYPSNQLFRSSFRY